MTPADLTAYAEAMKRGGVLRVSGEEDEGEDFTIELHPSVFGAQRVINPAPPGSWKCSTCGTEWTASLDRLCAACGTRNWPPPSTGDTAAALEAAAEAAKCPCGHDRVSEHLNGLCIAGACDPALCNPGAKQEGA